MRVLAVLVMLLAWPLVALSQQDPGFDPAAALGPQDTRFLQAALVWSGDYVGLTDGEWGARSEAALAAWLDRSGADPAMPAEEGLRNLLVPFAEEVAANGWTTVNLDGALTVALPTALLLPGPETPDQMELRSPSGDLVFRILFGTPQGVRDMHAWMLGSHAGPEAPYQSLRGDRLVSAITLENGKRVYLRSALVDGLTVSMQVVSEPWQRPRADLIASSMQWGAAPDLAPIPGGLLESILMGPAPPAMAFLPPQPFPPPPMPDRTTPATALMGTGTGFYVSDSAIVTAAHVVAGCRETRLEDGSALRLLSADPALDLAVLATKRRSPTWLPLAPEEGPRLGEPVFALGYPFFGADFTANQGLSVTGGHVSALPRVADATSRVMISAPVQPGNSGSPLLRGDGAVLGVVVSRLDDVLVLEREGALPQNMNQATSVAQLAPFLQASGVPLPAAPEPPAPDLSRGIPDEIQAAVVLIGCY